MRDDPPIVDPTEAPLGFRAVAMNPTGQPCAGCHFWHTDGAARACSLHTYRVHCMSFQRRDGATVIFERAL